MSTSEDTNAKKIETTREQIDVVDQWLNTAAENGLFKNQTKVKFEDVETQLNDARKGVQDKNLLTCEHSLSLALDKYYDSMNNASYWWKFKIKYAAPVWIYLVGTLVAVFFFYYFLGASYLLQSFGIVGTESDPPYFSNGIYAATWGVIGGVLRGFWYLKKNINESAYRNAFLVYYISSPFIGGILGILTYFIISAGVVTLTAEVDISNSVVVFAIATVAGYSWPESIELIRKTAENITGSSSKGS